MNGTGAACAPGTRAGGRSAPRHGNLLAPILGVQPHTITMHQNATVAQSIVASCFAFDGRRRKIVLQDLDFPTNHYLFEGFRRYGAESSTCRPAAPCARRSSAWWTRSTSTRRWCRFRWCCSAAPACRMWRRSWRRRTASARGSCWMSIRRRAPCRMNLAALGVDFAVGGSVKWLCGGPGAGYLYVRPDLIAGTEPGRHRLGGACGAIRLRDRRHALRDGDRTVSERHAERAVLVLGARGLRDCCGDWRAGHSRAVAAPDAAADRGRRRDTDGRSTRRPPTPSAAARSWSTSRTAPP